MFGFQESNYLKRCQNPDAIDMSAVFLASGELISFHSEWVSISFFCWKIFFASRKIRNLYFQRVPPLFLDVETEPSHALLLHRPEKTEQFDSAQSDYEQSDSNHPEFEQSEFEQYESEQSDSKQSESEQSDYE